ncbi:transcriptional attenuator, LytR family [Phyllobacterium sp. YR620]|uniref:LCP family protein n=1 Tax=Phyllobacterium sp. YR620 TaxID=1881066 RepID=UPI000880C991|nr:LCP family protein [Phyllobacterium sp. YR620]SDP05669.1 transcriptional attenuator, LytR family [Phyllobacterium sp. YR620]
MSDGLINSAPKPEGDPQRRRRLHLLLASVTCLMLVILLAICGMYWKFTSNLRHFEVAEADLGNRRPAKASPDALNILIVGSDQQTVSVANPGERSDILMLAHLSADRSELNVVSFPRDLLVPLPACSGREGLPGQRAHLGMINSSFMFGGIGCTWKTVETLTAIKIDHVIKVDFSGFRRIVEAIGGVEYCISEPIHDKLAGLDLPAGCQTLNGEEALGYVRARYSIGDGTDIGRIHRQHEFFGAMAQKLLGAQLANPVRLFSFMDAATKSVITDPGFSPGVMRELAFAVQHLSSENIHFITMPWHYSTASPGRVEWVEKPAKRLFRSIAADKSLMDTEFTRAKIGEPQDSTTKPCGASRVDHCAEISQADGVARP